MPKQITQRIALEGGNEFRAGLKSLGAAGQEAFKQVTDAANNASSIGVRLAPILDSIQKKLKDVGTAASKVSANFNETRDSVRETGRHILTLGAVFTGTAIAFGLAIHNAANFGDELKTTAAALDLTTQEFQTLAFAAKQSNVEADQFGRAIIALNSKIADHNKSQIEERINQQKLTEQFVKGKITVAEYVDRQTEMRKEAERSVNVFDRLGISLTDSNGALVDGQEKLFAIADAFQKADSATQALLLTELGFRRSKGMADFLKNGRAGIIALQEEAKRVAPPLTDLQVFVSNKLDEAFKKATASFESASIALRLIFAPDLTKLVDAFTEAIVANRTSLILMASSVRDAIKPIIDDLVKLLSGEEVDPTSLVGQVKAAVLALASDIAAAIRIIISAWAGFVIVLNQVAGVINSIFGTNITGQAIAFATVIAAVTGVFGTLVSILTLGASIVGVLVAAFGGIPVILAAIGVAIGFIIGKQLPDLVVALATGITNTWNSIIDGIKSAWQVGIGFLTEKWDGFVGIVLAGINFIKEALKSVGSLFGGGGDAGTSSQAPGFAGGGKVRGPGTSTSDSILAWLSDQEFVINAKAVRHYGAAFFEALNAMRFPASGFSMGGLAEASNSILPRRHFAAGGLVSAAAPASSGRPVILKIGDQTFGPMVAGEKTVSSLERFAAGQQARSMGRKPTWKQS